MLNLRNIHKSYEEKSILDGVNIAVDAGDVVALIGKNGTGKSTLLRIITEEVTPDNGATNLHGETIGYVPQELAICGLVRGCFDEELEDWRIDYALQVVGLGNITTSAKVETLSGGQKTRLALAIVLATEQQPTVLVLDEPTNNLDTHGVAWLESFIKSFKGSVIFASHDRYFINNVATRVVELNNGKLMQYGGNYDSYKNQKDSELQAELTKYEQFLDDRKKLQKLRKQSSGQMKRASDQKYDKLKHHHKMDFNTAKSSAQKGIGRKIKAIDSKLKQLDTVSRPIVDKSYRVELDGDIPKQKMVLRLSGVSKTYSHQLYENLDLEIRGNEHVAIAGSNGKGKTTLLKIAAGMLEPDVGVVEPGTGVRVGYFSQDVSGLDYSMSGFENLETAESNATLIYTNARSLGLLEADLKKNPKELSRGQQAKLSFAKLLLGRYQLLVLDEPTNHLDIVTREHIESALRDYSGAVLVASHDKYFLEQIGFDRSVDLET